MSILSRLLGGESNDDESCCNMQIEEIDADDTERDADDTEEDAPNESADRAAD
ncbi:hypothetical protein [Halorubrum luteum]